MCWARDQALLLLTLKTFSLYNAQAEHIIYLKIQIIFLKSILFKKGLEKVIERNLQILFNKNCRIAFKLTGSNDKKLTKNL